MSEPVEERGRQLFVTEDLSPVSKAQISRHYVEYAEMSSPELAVSTSAKPPADPVRFC